VPPPQKKKIAQKTKTISGSLKKCLIAKTFFPAFLIAYEGGGGVGGANTSNIKTFLVFILRFCFIYFLHWSWIFSG
jgi:hypothetical protein